MFKRILSTGSTIAAFASLLLAAGAGAAQAARCPLGEIYRPSRGVCVSKEKAIEAGIYKGSGLSRDSTMRPQALAAIEQKAPSPSVRADAALAFAIEPPVEAKPKSAPNVAAPNVATPKPSPVAPSPFGSLVALEPLRW